MKTVKEVYGIEERSIVYSDGTFSPSKTGAIFPDDLEWRWDATVDYRKNNFKANSTLRVLIVNELCAEDYSASVQALNNFDRLYPKYLGGGLVEITEFNGSIKNTAIKLSKLLMRVVPFAKPHRVRDVCDLVRLKDSPCTVEYVREPSKVLNAYERVRSCMSDTELPLVYLQDEETHLAVIKAGSQIVGRCWVRGGTRSSLYRLSIFEGGCLDALSREGFEEDENFLEGVDFRSPTKIFPYLDSCRGRVDFDGEFVTPNPSGRYKTSEEGRIVLIE